MLVLSGQAGLVLGLGALGCDATAQDDDAFDAGARRALAQFLDTLIPADASGPGAVAAGAVAEFEEAADNYPNFAAFLARGCRWLDSEAANGGAPGFAGLDAAERIRIVERAATAPEGSEPRKFFDLTWELARGSFYARPESWAPLGYDGPPQPYGFPDYADPPARRG
jgi:hypothetical protein